MDYARAIEPVTVFKTRSAALIRQAKSSGQPVIITQNGRPTAVLQDVETFQRQRDALLMLKVLARGDAELRRGKGVRHAKALAHFDRTLAGLRRGKSLSD